MVIHGNQYNVKNGAIHDKGGKEIKGVLEFITPTIQEWTGGDTTVFSMPYRFKYSADEAALQNFLDR
ncbi:MAG: hypothetical protein K2N87_18430 [Eubacterium sp.]|nr:hypothetical protein [Eubacterium sp.]